jgi:hypothetical protein
VVEGGGGCDIVYRMFLVDPTTLQIQILLSGGLVGKKLLTFYVLACLIT